jgi:hypothetical protein
MNAIERVKQRSEPRSMTPAEIRMARALGAQRLTGSRYRTTIRSLHASALSPRPQISDELASILRAGVKAFASVLPPDVVELAGGVS